MVESKKTQLKKETYKSLNDSLLICVFFRFFLVGGSLRRGKSSFTRFHKVSCSMILPSPKLTVRTWNWMGGTPFGMASRQVRTVSFREFWSVTGGKKSGWSRKTLLGYLRRGNVLNQSGQIIIFHQPRFPWNKGSHFPSKTLPFGVRSIDSFRYKQIWWLDSS